jgi:predicted ATP-dependent serine protease
MDKTKTLSTSSNCGGESQFLVVSCWKCGSWFLKEETNFLRTAPIRTNNEYFLTTAFQRTNNQQRILLHYMRIPVWGSDM